MQKKIFSYLQIALLATAVILGNILYNNLDNNPSDGLRMLHRSAGLLSAVAGIIAIVATWKISKFAAKTTGILSVIATSVAGYAGSSLKSTDNYDQMFNLMRGMGTLALVLSIITLVLVIRGSKKTSDTADK